MGQSKAKRVGMKRKSGHSQARLPLLLLLGGLLLVTGAAYALISGSQSSRSSGAPQVTGAPGLKVDQEIIDFGDVKLGRWVTASFELTNVGDEPLQFKERPYIKVLEGC